MGQYPITLQIQAKIVSQNDREWLVTNQWTTGKNGMPKPFHFYLAGVGESAALHQFSGAFQEFLFFTSSDLMLKFITDVEMIL
ncbi:hypothetical protein D3C81_2214130 [compost metagenome]